MKTTKTILALAAGALLMPLAMADEIIRETVPVTPAGTTTTVTVRPIEAAGTIAEFGDASIAVRTETTATPVQYRYSKTTQWVDEAGNVVTRETVKTGVPVTVYYTKDQNGFIVSKVVVRKQAAPIVVERPAPAIVEKKTTTTTTTTKKKEKKDDDDDDKD